MTIRKRSPQCPSVSLEEAIEKADKIYDKENKHVVANDAVAQALGYKNANNGAAARTMASLSYYGLLVKSGNGKLSVSPDYEKYKFAPKQEIKQEFLKKWINNPKVFSETIDKYGYNLPSDSALKYALIEMGFKPDAADNVTEIIKESVHFFLENSDLAKLKQTPDKNVHVLDDGVEEVEEDDDDDDDRYCTQAPDIAKPKASVFPTTSDEFRSIPIFLPNNREAILHLPRPFYKKDRDVIKRQIDALLTDDEE